MIPSNLENMGKCLCLIKCVRVQAIELCQLLTWHQSFPAAAQLMCKGKSSLRGAICPVHLQILLCPPVSQNSSLVTATVTRPLGFTTAVLPCPNPSVQKPVLFIHNALCEGQKNIQTRPGCKPFSNYLSIKCFILDLSIWVKQDIPDSPLGGIMKFWGLNGIAGFQC